MSIQFEIPTHHKSIVKVVGVGGGGSNAVTHMSKLGIKDVEFVIFNTDMQALKSSAVPNKIQIGANLTEGLGAGANPEVGKAAALESKNEIREFFNKDTKMVFVTAGMGGGTGTGAAPVIAQIAKELDILTVGIVTAPFSYEGKRKMQYAEEGISELKKYCDTVLVVSNDKLREIYGNLKLTEAFSKADDVLTTAAKSIAEIITVRSDVNVDFQDVKTVMKDAGAAVMGSAEAEGPDRAVRAVEAALNSPLLNDADIEGAQKVLLSVTYSSEHEITMEELGVITDYIEEKIGIQSDLLIPGYGSDDSLGAKVRVTIIATGFEGKDYEKKTTYFKLNNDSSSTKEVKTEISNSPIQQKNDNEFIFHVKKENIENTKQIENEVKNSFSGSIYTENQQNASAKPESSISEKRIDERKRRLMQMSSELSNEEIKDKLERPAFERLNVKLEEVPYSSKSEVSRFRLNEDNELLGDNKFLHDNVD